MVGLLANMVVGCRGRPEPMSNLTGPEADLVITHNEWYNKAL